MQPTPAPVDRQTTRVMMGEHTPTSSAGGSAPAPPRSSLGMGAPPANLSKAFNTAAAVLTLPDIPWRDELRLFLARSILARWWDLLQLVLSVVSSILYVYDTYQETTPYWLWVVDLVLVGFFLADWFMHFLAAGNTFRYVISFDSIIDILTILPVLVTIDRSRKQRVSLTFFRIFRTFRILRILRHLNSDSGSLELQRQIAKLLVTVLCAIFCSAGIIQELEEDGLDPLKFHEATYFIVITLTTVGYGDFSPKTGDGQFFIAMLIIVSVVYVPVQASNFYEVATQFSAYTGRYTDPNPHVILVGHLTPARIRIFVKEFFHEDHGETNMRIVLLDPAEPNAEMKTLLNSPAYSVRATYLRGSAVVPSDLERACVDTAQGIFLLSDLFALDPIEVDEQTTMRAIAIRQYSAEIPVFAELILQEKKRYLKSLGIRNVVCIEELKIVLMSQNCLCPGLSTLLSNLAISYNAPPANNPAWLTSFLDGMGKELYKLVVPSSFRGKTFSAVAQLMYERFGVILLSVELAYDNNEYVVVNPGKRYVMQGTEVAFIVAESQSDLAAIAKYTMQAGTQNLALEPTASLQNIKLSEVPMRKVGEGSRDRSDSLVARGPLTHTLLEESASFANLPTPSDDAPSKPNEDLGSNWKYRKIRTCKLQDHLLVCGSASPAGLRLFLTVFRDVEPERQVVFLSQEHPSEKFLRRLGFDNVFFVIGSPSDRNDLQAVNASEASKVVILSSKPDVSLLEQFMVDASSILAVSELDLDKMAARADDGDMVTSRFHLDLVFSSSARFIKFAGTTKRGAVEYLTSPVYASGTAFVASHLGYSLLTQAFYNRNIIDLMLSIASKDVIQAPPAVDSLRSSIAQIECPSQIVGKTFGEAFRRFVERGVLAIALYRAARPASYKKPFRYVLTCPDSSVVLEKDDKIIILKHED